MKNNVSICILGFCLYSTIVGDDEIADAVQDYGDADDDFDDGENQECHDFEYDEHDEQHDHDDEAIYKIPKDLDSWEWAISDSETEDEQDPDKAAMEPKDVGEGHGRGIHRVRVAEQREEHIQCKEEGLLFKPEGSTLGVHPASQTWRASYCGSTHYGRSWGSIRSPRKALLEVLKLILEEHVNKNKSDKIAKGQLARVTKAWADA